MASLTFYGGVNEIGGNKILLEDQDTRLFLDFGMSFTQSGKYFAEFMQPRKHNCLRDFYATGMLPVLEGVYREDYLEYMGCGSETRSVDGLLLSHAHADHAQYIHHLRADIPLYMSPESRAILVTLEQTGVSGFSDLTCRKREFCIRPKKRGEGFTKLKGDDAKDERPIRLVESGKRFNVGPIEVTPFEVDHSLPGATAYLIHSSEGNILYTGDLRFHGYRAEKTFEMVEAAAEEGVDLLLTEGTRVQSTVGNTENDVSEEAKKVIEDTSGLVAVNFPQRDLDRLITFHRVAEETGRKLVLSFKHAYMLELFEGLGDYPTLNDPEIRLFADRKGWGLIGRDDYPENIVKQDYLKWERRYLDLENTVTCEEVKKNQADYMFYCNFFQLNRLIDIEPVSGSRYIRSLCEPFNDEMALDERRVQNWLDLFGFGDPVQIHASGHASGNQIQDMITRIQPKQIVPIHTENPGWFKKFSQTRFAEKDKTMIL